VTSAVNLISLFDTTLRPDTLAIAFGAMIQVKISHILKRFAPGTLALDDICLDIAAGELFFFLGPSGCGKSTLLRIIAGLLEPSGGQILFNDRDVTNLPTQKRNAVMCFQSYALWPHMTVRQNIRFGLSVRGLSPGEQENRVAETLRLVQLTDLAERRPNQLSGGQQQRVALARALAVQPDCLLLDEPLSNLDAKLRVEMRGEIRRICKTAHCTTLYVTHDQKEALSVADRMAVLKDGKVIQTGTPAELYHQPSSSFVADFLGQTNLIPGRIAQRNGKLLQVQTPLGLFRVTGEASLPDDIKVSIRPEQIHLARTGGDDANRITGKLIETTFLGESSEHVLLSHGQRIKFNTLGTPPSADDVTIEFTPTDALALIS
jgi:iron(III) transport system ATP-binding protein